MSPVPDTKIIALDILSVPLVLTLRWRGVTPCAAYEARTFLTIMAEPFKILPKVRQSIDPRLGYNKEFLRTTEVLATG